MGSLGRLARVFGALSDETRLGILVFLLEGERCVCEIVSRVGRAQPTVSLHLKRLEDLGIVESRREGRRVYYRICEPLVERVLRIALSGG